MILVDAGPLVAVLHASDQHHRKVAVAFRSLQEPMATVWPAFTEAMYLLRGSRPAQSVLWQMVLRETIGLMPLTVDDAPRMRELMEKYHDLWAKRRENA